MADPTGVKHSVSNLKRDLFYFFIHNTLVYTNQIYEATLIVYKFALIEKTLMDVFAQMTNLSINNSLSICRLLQSFNLVTVKSQIPVFEQMQIFS